MGEAARIWTTVGANIAPLKAGLAEAGVATSNFGKSFGAAFASHTKQMEQFGKSWSKYVSTPLLAAGALSAKTAIDFQKNMALISTSAGASAKDVGVLSKQVLALAASGKTPYGPNELAKALYHLKSLGYDNATAMNTLKVSIKGAMAGQSDLESTTSALGAAIRTNIKGTGNFQQAMATLNATVGAGNMKMQDLIGALGTGVLPAAKMAGLSLKDVGSALALMVDEGMSAEAAATRLRQGFTLMASGSKQAEDALHRIGLTHNQLAQEMRGPAGLIGGIQLLKQHLATLGSSGDIAKWAAQVDRGKMSIDEFTKMAQKTEQFDVLSHAFGGARSAAAIELMVNNLDVLKQKYAQIGDTTKSFNAKVAQAASLSATKLEESKAQIEAAAIKLGNALTPAIVKLSHVIGTAVTDFDKLSSGTKKWLLILAGAATVAGPALIFTAKLIGAVRTIGGLFTVSASASKAAETTMVSSLGKTAAEAEVAQGAVLSLRAALLGIAGLGVISATVVIYELLKNRGQANYSTKGTTTPGGVNKQIVQSRDGSYHTTTVTGNRGSHRTFGDVSPGDIASGASTAALGTSYSSAASEHAQQAQSAAIAFANKAKAAAALKAARDRLAKQANAQISKLLNNSYGSTDYTPPDMTSLMGGAGGGGGGGKKSKVSVAKAKPVTNPLVAAAADYLGVPYVWGGASPAGFDCSGFIQYLYKKFGIDLPRTTFSQFKVGKAVAKANLKAGDVVFAPGSDGTMTNPGHEGLYIGGGKVQESYGRGVANHIVSLGRFISGAGGYAGARRFSNLSGDYTTGSVGRATSDYVRLADPSKLRQTAATFKTYMAEIQGLTGQTKTTTTAQMKAVAKALVQVVTPNDLSRVNSQLSGVRKVIAEAVTQMTSDVNRKKTAFNNAFSALAAAGAHALDKQLQSKLDVVDADLKKKLSEIASRFSTGPAEQALAAFERQQTVNGLQSDLSDAQDAYTQALAGGDPQAIKDAAKQLQQAQTAITEDQLQQQSDAEQKANDQSQTAAEDAANSTADAQKAALQDQYDRLQTAFTNQVSVIQAGMDDGSIAVSTGLGEISGLFAQFGIDLNDQGPVIAGTIYDTITSGLIGATNAANDLAAALATLNLLKNVQSPTSSSITAGSFGGGITSAAANAYSQAANTEKYGGGSGLGGAAGMFLLNPVKLAKGGVAKARPGGILANIAEGGEDEIVAPLSALRGMGGDSGPLTITVQSVLDGDVIAQSTHTHLLRKKKREGALGLA